MQTAANKAEIKRIEKLAKSINERLIKFKECQEANINMCNNVFMYL